MCAMKETKRDALSGIISRREGSFEGNIGKMHVFSRETLLGENAKIAIEGRTF